MIKWIKNLFVSKRLRAANERIRELETEVFLLKLQVDALEDAFLPNTPQEVLEEQYAAEKP